jgi:hypothetical protein
MAEMTIQERAARGLPLDDVLIIDAHAHFGDCSQVHAPFGSAEGMLASMERIGIRTTCISAHMAIGSDYHWGNDQVAEAMRRYPERFAGYVFINPNYPQDIEAEIARGMDQLGLWAVKIHPSINEYPPDGPAYQRVYAIMQERKGLVLSHTFGKAEILDKLSATYPDVTFINAHIGGGYDGRQPASWVPLVRERPNVYVDIVASPVPYGGLAKLAAEVGADKILFGTDTPFCDTAHQIGKVTHARLSDEDKRKILGLNTQRLMERHRR